MHQKRYAFSEDALLDWHGDHTLRIHVSVFPRPQIGYWTDGWESFATRTPRLARAEGGNRTIQFAIVTDDSIALTLDIPATIDPLALPPGWRRTPSGDPTRFFRQDGLWSAERFRSADEEELLPGVVYELQVLVVLKPGATEKIAEYERHPSGIVSGGLPSLGRKPERGRRR